MSKIFVLTLYWIGIIYLFIKAKYKEKEYSNCDISPSKNLNLDLKDANLSWSKLCIPTITLCFEKISYFVAKYHT